LEIDFTKVVGAYNITTDFLLSKLSEEQIFFYYFGRFELGRSYPSKFRKDGTPSTGFYVNRTGNIILNDLRTGEKLNCFRFVAKLYQLSYTEALNKIAADFGLLANTDAKPLAQSIINQGIEFDRELKKNTLIQFVPGQWTTNRRMYWNQYGLGNLNFTKADIYPVDKLFLNKNEIRNLDELCFAYVVREKVDGKEQIYVKIYSPYSENMKWLSNIPLTVPFGLNTLNYNSDHVIVTKAKKDMEVLKLLFPSVIGTQNESTSALTDKMVKHLCHNFTRRTIIWDADETGVEACKKFNTRGFDYFNTPKELLERDIKDVSDFVAAFGLKALEDLLRQKRILW